MSGVKGKSGRKRKSLNREDAMRSLTNKLPKAIEVIAGAMEGTVKDRLQYEAAIGIKDTVMGKPKQAIDQTITGNLTITPDMRLLAARELLEIKAEETKLLEGDYATIEEEG